MEKTVSNYQDQIYNFNGLWDVPSICGLKIVKKEDNAIVIVTDLFKENPGTPITEWNAKLAKEICDKNEISYNDLIFIEHTPKKETKLSFNHEAFFKVSFEISDNQFSNPKWKELTKEEVDELIKE